MKHEELRFEMFDMTRRVQAVKDLTKYVEECLKTGDIDEAIRTNQGIQDTLEGKSGWGYSKPGSHREWEQLKTLHGEEVHYD